MIFLVGYRGTGKTTVARLLAERLGWQWLDADAVLEARFGRSIADIFAKDGEAAFRRMETAVLEDLCRLREHVIATGGGVVLHASNRELMRRAGRIIWLNADVETIWARMESDAAAGKPRPPDGRRSRGSRGVTTRPRAVVSFVRRCGRADGWALAERNRRGDYEGPVVGLGYKLCLPRL